MFLTVVIKLDTNQQTSMVLEGMCSKYTTALKEMAEIALTDPDKNLDDVTEEMFGKHHQKIIYEARGRARLLKEVKIKEKDPVDEHVVLVKDEMEVDTENRVIKMPYVLTNIQYMCNRYQDYLLPKLEPVYLQIGKLDGQWYGWLLGGVELEDYLAIRKKLYEDDNKIQ